MTTPKVSVLMSVYNGEKYLREAVESILNQTFHDFEFVITDDGSTDGSWEILSKCASEDSRIILVRNDVRLGLTHSLNRMLELASSPYIARMDADDISLPDRFAKQVDFLDMRPEVGVLGCGMQIIDEEGNPSQVHQYAAEHGFLRWCLCFFNPITHPTVMMRREVVSQVGGYRSDLTCTQDYDLWQRLSGVTRLSNLQEVLHLLRLHERSVTSTHLAEQINNSVQIGQRMMSALLREEVPDDVARCLHTSVRVCETSRVVLRAAWFLYRLYRASMKDRGLSASERRLIRTDAARRLFQMAHPRKRDVLVLPALALACVLDPALVGQAIARPL